MWRSRSGSVPASYPAAPALLPLRCRCTRRQCAVAAPAFARRCFTAGADKSVAYELYNSWCLAAGEGAIPPHMSGYVKFGHAASEAQLVEMVAQRVASGLKTVIKPSGTGAHQPGGWLLDAWTPAAGWMDPRSCCCRACRAPSCSSGRRRFGAALQRRPLTVLTPPAATCPCLAITRTAGQGHGIEFFLEPEPAASIAARVAASVALVRRRYGCDGFPYTVCPFIDGAIIPAGPMAGARRTQRPAVAAAGLLVVPGTPGASSLAEPRVRPRPATTRVHPHGRRPTLPPPPRPCTGRRPAPRSAGRKFELRVVVYRDGGELRAFPSVAKVNRCTFDPANPTRESLLNNITTSANETRQSGLDFILPLCRQESLDTLGISRAELQVRARAARPRLLAAARQSSGLQLLLCHRTAGRLQRAPCKRSARLPLGPTLQLHAQPRRLPPAPCAPCAGAVPQRHPLPALRGGPGARAAAHVRPAQRRALSRMRRALSRMEPSHFRGCS
jgi:hypothetical protein